MIEQEEGKLLTRIPDKLRIILNENAKLRALYTAGCEIRFNLKSGIGRIILKLKDNPEMVFPIAEVYQGAFKSASYSLGAEPTEIPIAFPQNIELLDKVSKEKNLPFDSRLFRVILSCNYRNTRDCMPKLIHLDGRKILKSSLGLMAGDLIHPSPEGMEEMAGNLTQYVKKFFRN